MRFLFLTQYFPPEVGAAQLRLYAICKELLKRGHKITVVTGMPNYPKGEIFPEYRGKLYMKEIIESIPVIRTWIYPATHGNIIIRKILWKRLLNYFSFTLTSLYGILHTSRPDYIFVESPPLFLGISGYLGSRFMSAPYIFNVSDLWPDSVEEMGIIKNKILIKLAKKLEAFLYSNAFLINGVTLGIVDSIVKKGVHSDKVLFLPNGVDVDLFKPLPPVVGAIHELSLQSLKLFDKKVFIYSGIHGYAQSLETLLKA
ncbi:MAG: glycosyltransferase family 4 protein, partial [bacterium]|nr:glycosyltransferase family 4 protein [bacterium]